VENPSVVYPKWRSKSSITHKSACRRDIDKFQLMFSERVRLFNDVISHAAQRNRKLKISRWLISNRKHTCCQFQWIAGLRTYRYSLRNVDVVFCTSCDLGLSSFESAILNFHFQFLPFGPITLQVVPLDSYRPRKN